MNRRTSKIMTALPLAATSMALTLVSGTVSAAPQESPHQRTAPNAQFSTHSPYVASLAFGSNYFANAPGATPSALSETALYQLAQASESSPEGDSELSNGVSENEGEEDVFRPRGWGGVPAINYNSDEGFGYGVIARLYWYDQAKMDTQPYSKALTFQIFLTTKWIQAHKVVLDALDVFGLPLRVNVKASYYTTLTANFCGLGGSVTCDPDEATAYGYALGVTDEDLTELERTYYMHRYTEPHLWIDTRTKLSELPRKVEVMGSWRGSYYIPGTPSDPTLFENSLMSQPQYDDIQNNGFASVLQGGIMFDSRDFEPAPTKGIWTEASVRASHKAIGSTWNYAAANFIFRWYQSILPEGKLVFAERLMLDGLVGTAPQAELVRVGGSQLVDAFGGQYYGRGVRATRYVGKAKAVNQTELRWTMFGFDGAGQHFDVGTVAFLDLGYIAEDFSTIGTGQSELLMGTGGGIRFAWNRNFIIRCDIGKSPIENWGTKVYVNLDHAF